MRNRPGARPSRWEWGLLAPQAAGWNEGLSDVWLYFVHIVPKIGAFAFIMCAGGLAVRAAIRIINRLLDRAGADNLLDRGGLTRALRRPAHELRIGLLRLVFAVALLALFQLALGLFGSNPVSDLVHDLVILLAHAILACSVLVLGVTLASAARTFVGEALTGLPYANTAATTTTVLIMIGFGKAALDELGLATAVTTPLLYALLTTVTGVTVVGVGGGLIRPMQRRWEELLRRGGPELTTARATWRDNRARAAAEEPVVVPVSDLVGAPVGDLVTAGHGNGGQTADPADPIPVHERDTSTATDGSGLDPEPRQPS
ncbi:mechanosensitive ion channel family protein [Frankia sp. Cr2]|uniref:mechanosensitive ion channel family protein n=1 Tax=Frankia sp. Cr2 TaxID=3073932 RepID=UPI003A0FFA57